MHNERDHYWSAGGIPPHRERDRTHKEHVVDTIHYNGWESETSSLSAAMAASIESTGSMPDSAAAVISAAPELAPNTSGSTGALRSDGSSAHQQQDLAGILFEAKGSGLETKQPAMQQSHIANQTLKNSLAGAGAGCVSSVVTCPLDVVKTRLQYQGVLQEKYRSQGFKPYHGTVSTLRRIFTEEGVRGLYRGLAPMLMGYLPTWGIYFAAYESLKRELSAQQQVRLGSTTVHVVSAMGAGASTSTLTNPIWVLKSRFMTQSAFTDYRYTSMLQAVRAIYACEGLGGFYKGLGSSLLGVTHVAVQFPLYEQLKCWLRVDHDHQLDSSRILLASALSKMTASSVTYPHEVIRTRLQTQTTAPFKYKGIVHAVRLIYAEEGVPAFYRGLTTNLIRTVPASMMTLLTYELLIRFL
ncbi:hypothetical protein GGI11_000832 [Coemansia sp. RSA 2049]|nr:hypothetical protein GGI11_000832 [Coemansia sp. RSA 2049]KAJ2693237.1 hypothetical protein GGH99_001260 [Coemansia sp. RSA 1285]